MSNAKRLVWQAGKSWVVRGVRVGIATSVVVVAFGLVAARVSYARATQAGMDFGDELRRMGEHHVSGDMSTDAYEVRLNGQAFQASNGQSPHPMHEVLDFFQAQCNEDAGSMGEKFAHLDPVLRTLTPTVGVPGFLTVRQEQANKGFVFCMSADHQLSQSEQLHRLKVGTAGDFGKIGDMRYVSVHNDGASSSVVTAWTHGSFDVYAMFPAKGDAPGEDFANIPRPEGARRILSGTIAGAPFGVNAYEVEGTPEAAMEAVDAKLQAAGYQPTAMPKETAKSGRFYSLGNQVDVGINALSPRDGVTDVSYMVSRGVNTVTR